jgi:hypothetical protein
VTNSPFLCGAFCLKINTAKIRNIILSAACFFITSAVDASTIYSYTNSSISVICPDPTMTAYLESPLAATRFSSSWQATAARFHCRSVKSDRPLIITNSLSVNFHGTDYSIVEILPAGVVVSVDGFGGPYYILKSRIKKMPTSEQVHSNRDSLLPTPVHYSTEGIDSSAPTSTQK